MYAALPRLLILILVALPGLAAAQGAQPATGPMCRAECDRMAATRVGGATQQAVQACAIRCAATQAHLNSQAARGTTRAPDWVTSRPTGRTPDRAARSGRPAHQDHRASRPASARPPIQPTSTRSSTQPGTQPGTGHGAIYAARAPSAAFGLVVGEPDRMAAHRRAERSCAATGPGCRMLAEFTESCAAAAQGVRRSQWALFMTSDPASYTVTSLSAGSGRTKGQAEQQAVAECRARDPMATCRIAASACRG
ncbi:DUF4189 domain-containing protein [Roseomonas frigidaquae]|uniref:DUF4189 domain-containing protein n=1 Tax=Falsiroseomonas frigidaquae TaxID=487318 RepID=A0ABX1EUI7_9PROT|nr:DUF4189 domain-containing protein [Falsiroseomonas frigidaquae]NKE43707.1 DUF4189 domain-containing protein [Falsiroseomonas frigidaquae]